MPCGCFRIAKNCHDSQNAKIEKGWIVPEPWTPSGKLYNPLGFRWKNGPFQARVAVFKQQGFQHW
jgi:hypothetical protein